jgi:hypothetical protein
VPRPEFESGPPEHDSRTLPLDQMLQSDDEDDFRVK